jgi:CheY-like chemotaxis protein
LPTLLIVDDDAGTVDTLGRMLRLEGYDILTAPDTDSALKVIDASRPDAILVDLHMPASDGLAFLRRLRAQERDRITPAAVITGDYFVRDNLSEELRELHAELHYKPIWLADLLALVDRMLDRAK